MIDLELQFRLRSLSRLLYVITEEEDRFVLNLRDTVKQYADQTWVYSATYGLTPLAQYIRDWTSKQHAENTGTMSIHDALIHIYKADPKDKQHFYVITDPERWLADPHVVRRLLNIVHQGKQDNKTIKIMVFVGSRRVIPDKLSRYIEVLQDPGLTVEEITEKVTNASNVLSTPGVDHPETLFRGLTSYEIDRVLSQSVVRTRKSPQGPRIDPKMVSDFRRQQVQKTDLVQQVDTDLYPFSTVGGANRFKDWAEKTRASWTEKGRNFGLKAPKGVLCVGVWGCGKSLSVKALGNAWSLPVIQLEMGRLRSSGVGESEANVYRALRIVESVAPCLVWVDEAEKSLSGGASSNQSDAGTTSRTIGILSTWLQETSAQVCLALTANSLKSLPIEFVNRMDERFFFTLPSEEERIDIMKIHIRKVGQNPDNFDLASLSELASGLVGREIEQAIGAGMVESFAANKDGLDEPILANEFRRRPRILKTMVDEVKELMEWVGYDPDCDDGIRARFASTPERKGGAMKVA